MLVSRGPRATQTSGAGGSRGKPLAVAHVALRVENVERVVEDLPHRLRMLRPSAACSALSAARKRCYNVA
eukprot:5649282-Alexandrium_andersonii.AAC.1